MSRYFGWINGKPYDYVFKKRQQQRGIYDFYLGKYPIASLHAEYSRKDINRVTSWAVIVKGNMEEGKIPRLVHGFNTRHDAIRYALMVNELTRHTYNTDHPDYKNS